jgi:hypothetical protein
MLPTIAPLLHPGSKSVGTAQRGPANVATSTRFAPHFNRNAPMDPAPRGLAPPGAPTGAPLLDEVLSVPGLASAVLSHLAPADVVGLRASCRAAAAAVAGHGWDAPAPGRWAPAADYYYASYLVTGRRALQRWRAAFPRARVLTLCGAGRLDGDDDVTDADVATLAGLASLTLAGSAVGAALSDACLAPLAGPGGLTALAVDDVPALSGRALAPFAQRAAAAAGGGRPLQRLSWVRSGRLVDGDLAACAGATHVALAGRGVAVTDAGLAAHVAPSVAVLHVEDLEQDGGEGGGGGERVTGACLRGCARLEEVVLSGPCDLPVDAFDRCRGSLRRVRLRDVDVPDAALAGLPALAAVEVYRARRLTAAPFAGAPSLASLDVGACAAFTCADGSWADRPPPSLAALAVTAMPRFDVRGLAGLPSLASLTLEGCRRATPRALAALGGGACPTLTRVVVVSDGGEPDWAVASEGGLSDGGGGGGQQEDDEEEEDDGGSDDGDGGDGDAPFDGGAAAAALGAGWALAPEGGGGTVVLVRER